MNKNENISIFKKNINNIPKDILDLYYKKNIDSKLLKWWKYEIEKDKKFCENLTFKFDIYFNKKNKIIKDFKYWFYTFEHKYWTNVFSFDYKSNTIKCSPFNIEISYNLPYYHIEKYRDIEISEQEKFIIDTLEQFLEEKWYKNLPEEIRNIPTDLVWVNHMPFEDYKEYLKDNYKEWFIDYWEYFLTSDFIYDEPIKYELGIQGMESYDKHVQDRKKELWNIKIDRDIDFEKYCKSQYEWPYTIYHVVFGENE